jgi:hypothetical protein
MGGLGITDTDRSGFVEALADSCETFSVKLIIKEQIINLSISKICPLFFYMGIPTFLR